jgi:predicted PurR-regulated permease PerM
MFPMAVMIAFGVLAGVVDNLVRPLVLNGRSGLHPLVGLVAIIAAMIAGRFGVEVIDGLG